MSKEQIWRIEVEAGGGKSMENGSEWQLKLWDWDGGCWVFSDHRAGSGGLWFCLHFIGPHRLVLDLFSRGLQSFPSYLLAKIRSYMFLLWDNWAVSQANHSIGNRGEHKCTEHVVMRSMLVLLSVPTNWKTRYRRDFVRKCPEHTHRGNQSWKRHMHPSVHRSTVYNSQDMEAT